MGSGLRTARVRVRVDDQVRRYIGSMWRRLRLLGRPSAQPGDGYRLTALQCKADFLSSYIHGSTLSSALTSAH